MRPQARQSPLQRPGSERPEDQHGGLARIAVQEQQAAPDTSGSWPERLAVLA